MTIESIIESAIRGRATLSIFAILLIVATVLSALPVFAQEEAAVGGVTLTSDSSRHARRVMGRP